MLKRFSWLNKYESLWKLSYANCWIVWHQLLLINSNENAKWTTTKYPTILREHALTNIITAMNACDFISLKWYLPNKFYSLEHPVVEFGFATWAPGTIDTIQFLSSGVTLVNTSGSLLKLLMPITEYLGSTMVSLMAISTQISPSTNFRIVERTARVSSTGSKVWGSHSSRANVDRA